MATVKLDSFHPYVTLHVPNAPTPVMDQAIGFAIDQFCQESGIINVVLDPTPVVANRAGYDIPVTTGSMLVRVLEVWFNGRLLTPAPMDGVNGAQVLLDVPLPNAQVQQGPPRFYVLPDQNQAAYRVYPVPSDKEVGGYLTVRASLKPTLGTSQVPELLLRNWAEWIAEGAVSRLMRIPNQVFTNVNAADQHEARFRLGVSKAKLEATYSQTRGEMRIRPRNFFRS